MALTYRSDKGSPLTTDELDNNFRYFTGSQAVTGSLVVIEPLTTKDPLTTTFRYTTYIFS